MPRYICVLAGALSEQFIKNIKRLLEYHYIILYNAHHLAKVLSMLFIYNSLFHLNIEIPRIFNHRLSIEPLSAVR
jgi:hypothetical protein